jgi:hypothetical protein
MTEFIGWLVAFYFLILVVRMVIARAETSEAVEKFRAEADRRIRIVDLETVPEHNSILAFDKENNQFLGQGQTIEDVKACIMSRFPDKMFILGDKLFSAIPQINQANVEIKLENSTTR